MIRKPWQVTIDYNEGAFGLCLRVREHTHGSIAFSHAAVAQCGGEAETDDDGYVIRCRDEPSIVEVAREIARMSELESLK